MTLQLSTIPLFNKALTSLPNKKLLINTINAHCYNIAQKDKNYSKALYSSDILLPDGVSIVLAMHFLKRGSIKKIAGEDLFFYEMNRLNKTGGSCFFLGSSVDTLQLITEKAKVKFPEVKVACYSPPYVDEFSETESWEMIKLVNKHKPDVLFIGMTAPKQEKWAHKYFEELDCGHICSIGAVFDFFSGKIKRAPTWMINSGLEWLYRLLNEPRRLWRRYIVGNMLFLIYILKERFEKTKI
jgi:N-acetylglucosaminyldiphosphoundecaprenol N-acetyl-beta-D-mannosaminyltransferase